MFLVSSCSCLCPIYWSHVLSWEWRCSLSSAARRCSNYIWVNNNLIAHKVASDIRDMTVHIIVWCRDMHLGQRSENDTVWGLTSMWCWWKVPMSNPDCNNNVLGTINSVSCSYVWHYIRFYIKLCSMVTLYILKFEIHIQYAYITPQVKLPSI